MHANLSFSLSSIVMMSCRQKNSPPFHYQVLYVCLFISDINAINVLDFRISSSNTKKGDGIVLVQNTINDTFFPLQPLASGLQIIDVVSSASGGGVSASSSVVYLLLWLFSQRKRRLATLDSTIKKQRRN